VAELRHMPATMQDSAQDRRWLPRPAVGRRVMLGSGWQPGGGAEAVAGCRWLLREEEKASEALPRR
jgi:hypothetical protein